jgi:hypothetical protein
MRALLLALLASCSKSDPAKLPVPDPVAFFKLSESQQCAATEERAAACADDLVIADLELLEKGDPAQRELRENIEKDLRADPSSSDDGRKLHQAQCRRPRYTNAIVRCWTEPTCMAFARCVVALTSDGQ